MIINKIAVYLSGEGPKEVPAHILSDISYASCNSFSRQFGSRKESERKIRLSSIGRCVRQQAYKFLGFEENGKKLDARSSIVFFMGDSCETMIIGLAKLVGCTIEYTGADQKIVELDGVQGSPDGILKDPTGDCLVEVKSMSSYGFAEFQRGVIDEGYRYQCNAYMEALGLKRCVMIALNKDAGVLHEQIFSKDEKIVSDIRNRIQIIRTASRESLPDKPYQPNDKGFLPWNCAYCPVYGHCWPEAEKVLVGKSYKLKIKETENEAKTTA